MEFAERNAYTFHVAIDTHARWPDILVINHQVGSKDADQQAWVRNHGVVHNSDRQ